MNWANLFSNTLSWWQWAILGAVPPAIVLLYFLKLKRQPLEVPSTYLWARTIEDLHVNSIWQRLRQNLLLFLQLLLLAFAIFACLRPSLRGTKLTDNRLIFLIDTSASMSAEDTAPTRLEDAKRRVGDLIQQMKAGDVAMLVSFSDSPNVEQPFTDNRRLLLRRLEAIKPTQRPSDLDQAVRVAAGLANPGRTGDADKDDTAVAEARPATMYILSDGGFRNTAKVSLGHLKPVYVKIGEDDAKNAAITAFSTALNPEASDVVYAYGRIENFSGEEMTVETSLYVDGGLQDADKVTIPKGETGGVEFQIDDISSGVLRLEIDNKDHLALDNIAYAAINKPQRCKVLVISSDNDALKWALETEQSARLAELDWAEPDFVDTEQYNRDAQQGAYDLIIYDDCAPKSMPLCNTMFIGAKQITGRDGPEKTSSEDRLLPGWQGGAMEKDALIIDTNMAHPIMRYVETGDVRMILESNPLTTPRGASQLIDSDVGTIMAIAPRDGFEDLVVGFALINRGDDGSTYYNTDWIARYGFPVFLSNVLRYLGGGTGEQALGSVQPGQPVALRSSIPVKSIEVRSPDGHRSRIRASGNNEFVYGGTDEMGVYEVREGKSKEVDSRFAVNLFDSVESRIQPRPTINTEYEEIAAEQNWESTRREAWKYLLVLALVVLVVEWYIYNRRVYV